MAIQDYNPTISLENQIIQNQLEKQRRLQVAPATDVQNLRTGLPQDVVTISDAAKNLNSQNSVILNQDSSSSITLKPVEQSRRQDFINGTVSNQQATKTQQAQPLIQPGIKREMPVVESRGSGPGQMVVNTVNGRPPIQEPPPVDEISPSENIEQQRITREMFQSNAESRSVDVQGARNEYELDKLAEEYKTEQLAQDQQADVQIEKTVAARQAISEDTKVEEQRAEINQSLEIALKLRQLAQEPPPENSVQVAPAENQRTTNAEAQQAVAETQDNQVTLENTTRRPAESVNPARESDLAAGTGAGSPRQSAETRAKEDFEERDVQRIIATDMKRFVDPGEQTRREVNTFDKIV